MVAGGGQVEVEAGPAASCVPTSPPSPLLTAQPGFVVKDQGCCWLSEQCTLLPAPDSSAILYITLSVPFSKVSSFQTLGAMPILLTYPGVTTLPTWSSAS